MDEPVRVQLARELGLAGEDAFPLEAVGRRRLTAGAPLDAEQPPPAIRLDRGHRAVGGAVVEQVDLHALRDEVADGLADDVGLVVGGHEGDDREVPRHRRQRASPTRRW